MQLTNDKIYKVPLPSFIKFVRQVKKKNTCLSHKLEKNLKVC